MYFVTLNPSAMSTVPKDKGHHLLAMSRGPRQNFELGLPPIFLYLSTGGAALKAAAGGLALCTSLSPAATLPSLSAGSWLLYIKKAVGCVCVCVCILAMPLDFPFPFSAVCSCAQHTESAPHTTVVQGAVRSTASITVHCGLGRGKQGVEDIL